jgi:hypothetical protein
VRTTEELLEGKVAAPVHKTEIHDRGDPLRWPRNTLYPQIWHYFANKRGSFGRYISLEDESHGV